MIKAAVAVAFVALNFYIYAFLATDEVIPDRRSFDEFPLAIDEWHCPGMEEMDPKALKFLGATDYLICNYFRTPEDDPDATELVNFYAGFHASQVRKEGGGGGENAIHPPEHCLPGSGWDIIDSRMVRLDLPGLPQRAGLRADGPEAKRFVIAKGKARQLVYFWYQSRGRTLARSEDKILFQFWDRATQGRTDGSLVRFMTPIQRGDIDAAEARLLHLAGLVTPQLPAYLPE